MRLRRKKEPKFREDEDNRYHYPDKRLRHYHKFDREVDGVWVCECGDRYLDGRPA